jgi:hypothetical protein
MAQTPVRRRDRHRPTEGGGLGGRRRGRQPAPRAPPRSGGDDTGYGATSGSGLFGGLAVPVISRPRVRGPPPPLWITRTRAHFHQYRVPRSGIDDCSGTVEDHLVGWVQPTESHRLASVGRTCPTTAYRASGTDPDHPMAGSASPAAVGSRRPNSRRADPSGGPGDGARRRDNGERSRAGLVRDRRLRRSASRRRRRRDPPAPPSPDLDVGAPALPFPRAHSTGKPCRAWEAHHAARRLSLSSRERTRIMPTRLILPGEACRAS